MSVSALAMMRSLRVKPGSQSDLCYEHTHRLIHLPSPTCGYDPLWFTQEGSP
jgi:hypothetical protein